MADITTAEAALREALESAFPREEIKLGDVRSVLAELDRLRADVHNLNWALGAEGYETMATPEQQAEADAAHADAMAMIERMKARKDRHNALLPNGEDPLDVIEALRAELATAQQLAADRLEQMQSMQSALDAYTGKAPAHDYQGLCPDMTQPDSRDPVCLACRALMLAGAARAEMADDLKAVAAAKAASDAAHIAAGRCPECEGAGQQGGQFCGGFWTCETCGGSGKAGEAQGKEG